MQDNRAVLFGDANEGEVTPLRTLKTRQGREDEALSALRAKVESIATAIEELLRNRGDEDEVSTATGGSKRSMRGGNEDDEEGGSTALLLLWTTGARDG